MTWSLHRARADVFFRFFMAVLCVDCWSLMLSNAGEYSAEFNVTHFSWLDALSPTPALRVFLVAGAGACAFVLTIAGPRAPITALAALLYNTAWAMSLQDGFQHHYLLGLLLVIFVFWDAAAARAECWPVALTLFSFSIVYGWTAVNKLDPLWRAGFVIHDLWADELEPLRAAGVGLGISDGVFWRILGHSAAFTQVLIAIAYALVPFAEHRPNLRRYVRLGCVAALLFHAMADTLGLSIRFFGIYMAGAALLMLGPVGVSIRVRDWWGRRAAGIRTALQTRSDPSWWLCIGAVAAVASAGWACSLPGGPILAAAIICALALGTMYAAPRRSHALAAVAGSALFVALVHISHAPFEVHDDLAKQAFRQGRVEEARLETRRAALSIPSDERLSVSESDLRFIAASNDLDIGTAR